MRRRAFLQYTALALVSAAFVKSTTALQGFVANEPVPQLVNPLKPKWLYTQFHPYLAGIEFDPGIKCAYHHFESIPTVASVKAMMSKGHYDHWHVLGANEADYNGVTPQEYAEFVVAQSAPILQADPLAKFCIEGGMQGNPMYEPNSYFDQIWELLPKPGLRNKVRAIQTHIYVQQQYPNDPSKWFSPYPIGKELKKCRESLDMKGLDGRELWVGETGLTKHPYVMAHPTEAANYVNTIHSQCSQFADRWAWYVEMESGGDSPNYLTLTSYAAGPSAAGMVFASL